MEIISDITTLRTRLANQKSVAFVPTMGNLHQGHSSLIQKAQQLADLTVTSIFVNKLQFSQNEDFDHYPRTLKNDYSLLEKEGVDVVFTPNSKILYPVQQTFLLKLPSTANALEGKYRNNFFTGVATIVLKLFNIVQPQIAIFGKKDYQQLQIISEMVHQLNLPIEIVSCETVRAQDGLALSSRNNHLDNKQRIEASRLYQMLEYIKKSVEKGNKDFLTLENYARSDLSQNGWKVDYISLHQHNTLKQATTVDRLLIILGAAWLGNTRLIDNLECKINSK